MTNRNLRQRLAGLVFFTFFMFFYTHMWLYVCCCVCVCICVCVCCFWRLRLLLALLPCPILGVRLSALKYATKLLWCLTCGELVAGSCVCACVCVWNVCVCMHVCVLFSLSQWARDACFSEATSWFCLACKSCVCQYAVPCPCSSPPPPPPVSRYTHSGQLLLDLRKIKCLSHGKSGFLLSASLPSSLPTRLCLLRLFLHFSSLFFPAFFACHCDALTGKFWMQNPTKVSKKKRLKLRQGEAHGRIN